MQFSWSHRSKIFKLPNSPPPPLRLDRSGAFNYFLTERIFYHGAGFKKQTKLVCPEWSQSDGNEQSLSRFNNVESARWTDGTHNIVEMEGHATQHTKKKTGTNLSKNI